MLKQPRVMGSNQYFVCKYFHLQTNLEVLLCRENITDCILLFFFFFGQIQVRKANFNSDPYLQTFGISIVPQMVDVHGRVLNPPKIQYGGRVSVCIELALLVT